MASVELGFLEKCEPWRVESPLFPSKVGGKPAWLSLKSLPTSEELKCEKCNKVLVFLCQIYAPYDFQPSNKQLNILDNFHRSVFTFICRNATCNEYCNSQNIKVFRSSLAKENDFYSVIPSEGKEDPSFDITKWSVLCNLCGIFAQKRCSQCKNVVYCCKDHQVIDWKNGHKLWCSPNMKEPVHSKLNSNLLFPEWEVIIETEEIQDELFVSQEQEIADYKKLQADGKTGTLSYIFESDLDAHASVDTDKVFTNFKERIKGYPDQVIRYSRGGEPLLIAKEPLPLDIPNCQYCGGPRQFEFQIMPQMLTILKEHDLDWGVLLVYTCKISCIGDSVNSYKEEYIFKQDIVSNSLC